MADLPKAPQRGDEILRHFLRLRDFVRKERVLAGSGIRVVQGDAGKTVSISGRPGVGVGADDPTSPFAPGENNDPTELGHVYAFESYANANLDGIIMEPGDIMFEPGDNGVSPSEWIAWASITGVTTTPAVTATNVCVWLSVDCLALTAEMMVGTESAMKGYIAGLSAAAKKYTTMRPLVITTWASGAITRAKNLQCGDVIISRL